MATPNVYYGSAFEDGGLSLMARVVGNNAANIVQSDITSITCSVFDLDSATPDTAIATPTITVANVVYDTLQTDNRWTKDSTGYNFRYDALASQVPTGDRRYRWEFVFNPASGEDFLVVFQVATLPIRTS